MAAVNPEIKGQLRTLVRTYGDLQKLRIQMGNRICRNFSAQLGQEDGMPQDELSPEAKEVLETLRAEYKLLADALTQVNLKRWQTVLDAHAGIITTPYEYVLAESYVRLEQNEDRLGREIAALVSTHPLWTSYLVSVRGVGPILAAVILSELNPHLARHPSSFWKYAGLDVVEDGLGRSKKAAHLVQRAYTDRNGKEAVRDSITYNPFLKTKLIGVLGSSFLRAGGQYSEIYRAYKHRLESRPDVGLVAEAAKEAGATKLHRHNMATRYAVKLFLLDLWMHWRTLEGLPTGESYAEAKLGLRHGEEAAS